MPQIEVSPATNEHIKALALLLETTPARVVEQLVRQAKDSMTGQLPTDLVSLSSSRSIPGSEAAPTAGSEPEDTVAVYITYLGHRVAGTLVPRTGKLTIISPPWNDKPFDTPSGAASAVIQHFNPDRVVIRNGKEHKPSVNGWREWRLVSSDELIQTVRPV